MIFSKSWEIFFGLFWEFYWNSLEILWEFFGDVWLGGFDFGIFWDFWGILWEFVGDSLRILWEFFGNSIGILWGCMVGGF